MCIIVSCENDLLQKFLQIDVFTERQIQDIPLGKCKISKTAPQVYSVLIPLEHLIRLVLAHARGKV